MFEENKKSRLEVTLIKISDFETAVLPFWPFFLARRVLNLFVNASEHIFK